MTKTMNNYIAKMRIKSGSALAAGLLLFAILIASAAMPDVPDWLTTLFSNTIFKLLYLTVVLIMFNYCPLTALLIALIFIIIVQSINKYALNRANEPKHNIKETAKSIIQSVADTSSELVSDSGEIIKTIGRSVSHARNYIINEDSFENLKPTVVINDQREPSKNNYIAINDLYSGKPFPQTFSDTVSEKNSYFDKTMPLPESQCIGQPGKCDSKEMFALEKNYNEINDLYSGKPFPQTFSDTVSEKNSYFDKTVPLPESQCIGQPGKCDSKEMFALEKNYTAISDKYVGPPHPQTFSDTVSIKNNYFDKTAPQPESQRVGQPTVEQFIQEKNYSPIKDLYVGLPFAEQYPKYEGKYTGHLVALVPQPLDQESVFPPS